MKISLKFVEILIRILPTYIEIFLEQKMSTFFGPKIGLFWANF